MTTVECSVQKQDCRDHCVRHVEEIDLEKIANENYRDDDDRMGKQYAVRSVNFRFGHIFVPRIFNRMWKSAFHLSFNANRAYRSWRCSAKARLSMFTMNERNEEDVYFSKELHVCFDKNAEIFRYTITKLCLEKLLVQYRSKKIFASIQLYVDPSSGLKMCLPLNETLQFGQEQVMVNKEFLAMHSDYFKTLFAPNSPFKTKTANVYPIDLEAFHGNVELFKLMYEILEKGTSPRLNEENVAPIMQMANAFLLDAVEAACMDHLNSRKCQLSLPEKVVIFNTIGAESAKRSAIKRARTEMGGDQDQYFRGLKAARRLTFGDLEEIKKTFNEVHGCNL